MGNKIDAYEKKRRDQRRRRTNFWKADKLIIKQNLESEEEFIGRELETELDNLALLKLKEQAFCLRLSITIKEAFDEKIRMFFKKNGKGIQSRNQ